MDVMQAPSDDPRRSKRHPMRTAASTCELSGERGARVAGRPGASWPTWTACALALIAGCTASADEVHPKKEVLAFPSGLAIAPNEKFLFVANANSELRFDSGSIGVFDVDAIHRTIADWLASDGKHPEAFEGCHADLDHAESILCDAVTFMKDEGRAGVRIGNFATDIALQDFSTIDPMNPTNRPGPYRVFVPTRGDPSIAWADFVDGALSCTDNSESFALCDDAHRLSTLQNDPDLQPLPEEPFGVYADGPTGVAVVSHLNNGAVTLIAAPPPSSGTDADVRIVDVRSNFFNVDVNNSSGATGITARPSADGEPDNIIYVGSRSDHRVQTFTVGTLPVAPPSAEQAPKERKRKGLFRRR